jgi:TetR/AcrR family transcriptional regulator
MKAGEPLRWGGQVPSALDLQDQKKLEMLKASALFFSKNGYHSTSLTTVAQSIGITKSLFYYYFKDKQELLYQCSLLAHTKIQFVFPDGDTKQDFLSNFLQCLVTYMETVNANNFQFVMFMEPDVLSPEQLLSINKLRDRFEQNLRDVIVEGQRLELLVRDDAKILGFSLLGSVNWLARWWRQEKGQPLREIATEVAYVALRGLVANPRLLDAHMAEVRSRAPIAVDTSARQRKAPLRTGTKRRAGG